MATIDLRGASLSAADPPIATNPNPDLAIKAPVRVATTGSNITLSGLQTIDGVALAAGDRILVKDQTDQTTNGIYNAQTGPWTRTIDGNNNSQWTTGTQAAVAAGSINGGASYKLTTAIPVILATSLMVFGLVSVTNSQGANPTAKVGLTAVNGSALTFMRSDGAPAIDQAILPTWTGLHTFAAGIAITPPSGATQGLAVTQTGSGTGTAPYSFNAINITDNLASTGTVDGFSIFQGLNGSAVNSARQAFQSTIWLVNPTSASNPNRYYTAGSFVAQAIGNDGGGLGTEKGSIFAVNVVATLAASSTRMAQLGGGEVDISCASGSSVLDKYGWIIVQLSTDAVQGSRNDAAQLFVNQGGAVGWGTLIQVGNGLNASPLTTAGSILAIKGSPTFTNGIDLSGAGTISGSAFKSPGFSVTGAGALVATGLQSTAFIASPAPTTLTGTSGSAAFATPSVIVNASGTFTLTLPAASGFPGAWFYIRSIAAQIVNSASSNIVPLAGGAAAAAILTAGAGKWAWLQSDGTNYQIMAGVT